MIRCLIVVCLYSINHLFGQYNLVPNPSFETCYNCPNYGVIGEQFTPNNVILANWDNPGGGNPDYLNCVTPSLHAQDGSAFVGIGTYVSPYMELQYHNAREYLQCELTDSLIFNKKYLVKFFTLTGVLSNNSPGNFASNNIGLHFSDTLLHTNNEYVIPLISQVKYFNNEIISDTSTWTKVSGIYEAEGGEKFMTVGNFNFDSETNFICFFPFWPAAGCAHVWFDNFSVTPLDSIPGGLQVNAGNDQSICIGDTVFIGEKISNLPANWYLLDGTIVDTNTAGVYVHPSVTTTYVVTMTINGVYSTDTVTVTVGCAGVDELEKLSFRIGPNPNDGDFTLTGQIIKGQTITIKTMDGKVVYSKKMDENLEQQKIHSNLGSGVYFIIIEDESNHFLSQNKFIVTK
jgi:hypothetical protein